MTPYQQRKKSSGGCITPYCRNERKQGNYCYKCVKRKYREKNPVKAAYHALRSNAARRGKEFSLTLDQFAEFVERSGYMDNKGRLSSSWHIDRIDSDKGYHFDNIRVLTNAENNQRRYEECPF